MTGKEAKAMREAAGLNRTELAARLGVTERTVYRYEDGESQISGPVAIALRQVLAPTKKTKQPAA